MVYNYSPIRESNPANAFSEQSIYWEGYWWYVGGVLTADPIWNMFLNYHGPVQSIELDTRYTDKSKQHLIPVRKNAILAGLQIIADLRRSRGREEFKTHFPSWNRRRSFDLAGDGGNYDTRLFSQLVTSFTLPTEVNAVEVLSQPNTILASGGTTRHLPWDGFVQFSRDIKGLPSAFFKRTSSLSRYFTAELSGFLITPESVEYQISGFAKLYPSTRSQTGALTIKYERVRRDGHNFVRVSVKPFSILLKKSAMLSEWTPSNWVPILQNRTLPTDDLHYAKARSRTLCGAQYINITDFAPALYHTQAKALSKILIDIDKNFEAIVEAPEFLGSLAHTVNTSVDAKSFLTSKVPRSQKFMALANAASGIHLAWQFGLKPVIDLLFESSSDFRTPLKGEAEMYFSFGSTSELPGTFADLLQRHFEPAFDLSQLHRGVALIRTEAWTSPTYREFVQMLCNDNILFNAQVMPTPSGIYQSTKLSFALDWFLPLGTYIDDGQTYLMSFTLPFRMGHSVRLELTFLDGTVHRSFWRSSETNRLLDPPTDSWLSAPGLPLTSISLATQMLCGLVMPQK